MPKSDSGGATAPAPTTAPDAPVSGRRCLMNALRRLRLLPAALLAVAGIAAAQECTWEIEPNDLPHQATLVTGAGPDSSFGADRNRVPTMCLAGEFTGNDQDMFLLEVDEHMADQLWTVGLEGFAQGLTRLDIMDLEFLDNQVDVTARTDLLTVQSLYGRATTSEAFLLEPGRYWFGFSKDGGAGEYVAMLRSLESPSYRSPSAFGPDHGQKGEFRTAGAIPDGLVQPWLIEEPDAETIWRIELNVPLGRSAELVLEGPDGTVGSARTDRSGYAQLDGFGLTAGNYTIEVKGGAGNHLLRTSRRGRRADGVEVEPNNSRETANTFPPGTQMRGSTTDDDWFLIDIPEGPEGRYTLSASTDGEPLRLLLEDADGNSLLDRDRWQGDLTGLGLAAGSHYLRVSGPANTEYTLSVQPGSAPAAGWESEPNDTIFSAMPLDDSGQVRGELSSVSRDTDMFRFEVSGEPQLFRVQLVSKGTVELSLLTGGGQEQASTRGSKRLRLDNLQLMSGTHYLKVTGDAGEYALQLLSLGPVPEPDLADLPPADEPLRAAPAPRESETADEAAEAPERATLPTLPPPPPGLPEREPNDDRTRAELLTPGIPRVGTLPNARDTDYYRFFLAHDQPVRLELVPPEGVEPLSMHLDNYGWIEAPHGSEPGVPTVADVWLPAGDHYLEIRRGETGNAWYQLRLTQLNAALPWPEADAGDEAAPELPLDITLAGSVDELAAYWHQGQETELAATVSNRGGETLDLTLAAAVSDARAEAELQESLRLEPGGSATVPLRLLLPADLRDDIPLNVSVAATAASGQAGGQLALTARCEAPPVGVRDWWPLPQPLLGGINVLWDALGADLYGPHAYEHRARALIDGIVTPANGGFSDSDPTGDQPTFVLAGTEPAELLGAVLHPLTDYGTGSQLRRFRIETSLDGRTFETAFEGHLNAARIDQSFVFDRPVRARYARLAAIDNQARWGTEGWVGEFRLIAADKAAFGPFDLSVPELGGHIVWSDPMAENNNFLADRTRPLSLDLRDHAAFTFVLGFHNTRAAQLTRLEWEDFPEALSGGDAFAGTTVEVSMGGAAGPWEELADWQFERGAGGTAVLEFSEPVWARYLRFTATKTDPEQRYQAAPKRVSAFERPAGGDYLSIIGEWGTATPAAIFELLSPPAREYVIEAAGDNDTMQTATPLASGATAEGTVLVGEDIDWYRLRIGPGENRLEVRLSGEPVIAYDYELVDAWGAPVAAAESGDGNEVVLTFFGDPGDYYLKIEEPKRSVVFSWDTSGSMGPYRDITYNALATFARGVDDEREKVQLLAYNDPAPTWLLPLWTGDSERVQRTVNDYTRKDDSSSSETALLSAVKALGQREGTRAILLITDAETTSYGYTTELWKELDRVRPRIFTFEVSSIGQLWSQQLMQGWAAVNHGFYSLSAAIGDLDAGYSRASCILRRPKHYRIETQSSAAAPPGPGSLRVTRPEDAAGAAVEIIFDASGSMGVALPSGEQRINAAKRVLEELVTGVLPAGSPFALRAFGHVEPTTCNMRLEVPFGPLDPDRALQAVRGIEMKLLSQTPLAEAILATADDLASAGRSRTIILITDGVESCGGDPAEAVRELRRRHPVDVAIVSLGIPAEEIAEFTELAEAVNASYVDVASFEELQESVAAALNPAFEVFDADGVVVASGVVDGPAVDLEAGVYTVRVTGAGVREYPGVQVPGEKSVSLTHAGQ